MCEQCSPLLTSKSRTRDGSVDEYKDQEIEWVVYPNPQYEIVVSNVDLTCSEGHRKFVPRDAQLVLEHHI